MYTAIIHFENHKHIAKRFSGLLTKYLRENNLILIDASDPKGITDILNPRWTFISYITLQGNNAVDTKDPANVADDTAEWIANNKPEPERFVFITDLNPEMLSSSDSILKYGPDVLAKLSEYLRVQNVRNLVADKNILVVFLTGYGLEKALKLHNEWKNIDVKVIGYGDKGHLPTVPEALNELQQDGAKVIHVDRGKDEEWAAELISKWI